MKYSVLIVDDDKLVNDMLTETVTRAGYDCVSVFSGEEALERFKARSFDIVLTDLKMNEMDGITLLGRLKELEQGTQVVLMTAYGTVETAVRAIKLGAHDFLVKPVSPETVEHTLGKLGDLMTLRIQNAAMRRDVEYEFRDIIGKSKVIKSVFDKIQSVARQRSTVLLTGPTGTGKELVARAIHFSSDRRDQPFIKLNCSAMPDTLVESELFGHEKGAFTDARRTHRGRFELADGGTLLLDEISEMPLKLQSKLLRVIQEREFERIGSTTTISVDVRLIATSNRNLHEYVAAGKFREDLFWRLDVFPIVLPTLKDRPEDIPLLVEHFISKYNAETGKEIKSIAQAAMNRLMKYDWPGNIRQLENYVERAIVASNGGTLTEDDFPSELSFGSFSNTGSVLKDDMTLDEGTKYLIFKTLERFDGNKTRAAEALGITARTIRNKLAEYETDHQVHREHSS